MSAVATISPEAVSVQPGKEAACEVRIRNTGTVVDEFALEALGDAAGWASFEPSSVSLFPDAEGVARLILRPPVGPSVPSGPCPMGVRVRSHEDPRHPVVEELTVDVGRVADTFAEVLPRTSRGSRRATHHVAIDNRGNARLNATVSATDPDDRLEFAFEPPSVVADPNTAAFTKLTVQPLKRFLRGQPVTHPFRVKVEPEGEVPLTVEGTMIQEALIPRWVPRAIMALLVMALASVIFWKAVLNPAVKSSAQDAAKDVVSGPLAQTSAQLAGLAAKLAPSGGGAAGGGATPTTTGTGAATDPLDPSGLLGRPTDFRLQASEGQQTVSFVVPDKQTFSLTDIVLQNPDGDRGLLRIQRGDTILLSVRLENFRDIDYHFVSPVVFTANQALTLAVACENPPPRERTCAPAAYYSGFVRDVA